MRLKQLTLYYVGVEPEDARESLPFDSYESADSYRNDNPGTFIYNVTAVVDFNTMELED